MDKHKRLIIKSPAKLNLCLDIIGKKSNGYHLISSVVTKIELSDEIIFEDSGGIKPEVIYKANSKIGFSQKLLDIFSESLTQLSRSNDNCLAALRHFYLNIANPINHKLTVIKSIPLQSGMGGGSSNAWHTLLGLNLLNQNCHNIDKLQEIAINIGSDVVLFSHSGTVIIEDEGNSITPLSHKNRPALYFVVVCPQVTGIKNKTAFFYSKITKSAYTPDCPRTKELIATLQTKQPSTELPLQNVFTPFILKQFPHLAEPFQYLQKLSKGAVSFSGSGTAFFTTANSSEMATAIKADFAKKYGYICFVTKELID